MFSLTSNAHSVLGSQACHAARLAAEAAGEEARAAVAQELNALRRRVEDAHLNGYLDEGSSGGSGHLPSYYTSTQAAGGVGTNNNHATGALVATTTGEAATVEIAVLRAALKESEEEAAMLRAAVATSSNPSTDASGKAPRQASTRPRMPSPTAARDALLRVDTAVAAAAASSSLSTPPANFGRRSPTNGGAPRAASSTSFARSSSPLGRQPPLSNMRTSTSSPLSGHAGVAVSTPNHQPHNRSSNGEHPSVGEALATEAAKHAAEVAELNRVARATEEALRREVTLTFT